MPFKRAGLLLFFGWALYFIPADGVLVFPVAECAGAVIGYLYRGILIRDKSIAFQSVFFIHFTGIDLAYRYFPVRIPITLGKF